MPIDPAKADTVMRLVHDFMAQAHLKAVIVRVTVDGKEIVTQAVGDSITGVPATTDMHFRNGAVAISYVSTLLLKLVDQKRVSLDDRLSKWLPDFPHSERVTLGQLAQMTSGYPDYILGNDAFDNLFYANPFRQWTTQDILTQISSRPLLYDPGTNWNYAHTNYVLLGLALEKATGQDMPTLLRNEVLGPLGLKATANSDTPAIPQPALHEFSSERRQFLKIPAGTPFYEESTYWNPSWTITHGAIQTTNIYDLEATAVGIGSGKLLSPDS
jgi:CubicO group peptidase (beta-lactamase class C family)